MGVAALTRPTAARPLRVRRGDREKNEEERMKEVRKQRRRIPLSPPTHPRVKNGDCARGHERRLESRRRERRRTGKKEEKEKTTYPPRD